MKIQRCIKRGEIYYADLNPVVGSEQGGIRPVLILQNNMGNRYSPTVIIAALTCKLQKVLLPTHIKLSDSHCRLLKDSIVLLEQIRTIDCSRLRTYIGHLDGNSMIEVDNALSISVGLQGIPYSKCFMGKKKYKSITTEKKQLTKNRMEALYELYCK